jgi:hypothetical protein
MPYVPSVLHSNRKRMWMQNHPIPPEHKVVGKETEMSSQLQLFAEHLADCPQPVVLQLNAALGLLMRMAHMITKAVPMLAYDIVVDSWQGAHTDLH